MRKCYAFGLVARLYEGNGWGGIRTPGAFRHTRSPGVHNQPLCHPSIDLMSKLQSLKQFVERQLDTDIKFTEVGVLGANWIKTHFVNDCFDLKCVARK
jgi:hypothetical protein